MEQSHDEHASAADRQAATPNQRVLNDRYELGELIGRGGMADVWKARDLLLGRDVAVKILRADLARDPVFQARFRREAKAVAGLNDPAIVAVYDTGDADVRPAGEHVSLTVPFIVMEFVSGHTLKQRLSGGPLPVPDAVNATLGVLAALNGSHAQSIVHRDIKPANVMITDTGSVKVMDFGIARALADSAVTMTQTQAVVGTAQYLSPEQARGEAVDERSDLYSAGCLLFELLTGRPPFMGDSPVSVAYQHVGEQPPRASELNPAVTPQLEAVLEHALAKDREHRFQSAAEFGAALRAAQRGEHPDPTPVDDEATRAMTTVAPLGAVASAAPATGHLDTVMGDPEEGSEGFFDEDPRREEVVKKRHALVWVFSALLAVLVIAGGYFGYRYISAQAEQNARVEVPAVVNRPSEEAVAALKNAGFDDVATQEVYDDSVDKGLVTAVDPQAGTRALKHGTITLSVSKGAQMVTLPADLKGSDEADARKALGELGLEVAADAKQVANKDVDRGKVVDTDPGLGTEVKVGSTVTLLVSKGQVTIPDGLEGKSLEDATAALKELGLQVGGTKEVDGADVEPQHVVTSDPAPGTSVDYGSKVTLLIAKEQVTIPDTVLQQQEANVRSMLKDLGFDPTKITSKKQEDSSPAGTVLDISPAPGTKVAKDSDITLTVSSGLPEMPDVRGKTLDEAVSALADLGLNLSQQPVHADSDEQKGKVVNQSVAPGTQVAKGTDVLLQIGN